MSAKIVAVICSEHACKFGWPKPCIGYAPGVCDIHYCQKQVSSAYIVGEAGSEPGGARGVIKVSDDGNRRFVAINGMFF